MDSRRKYEVLCPHIRSEKQRQRQLGRKRGSYIRSVESSLIQEYNKEIGPLVATDRDGLLPKTKEIGGTDSIMYSFVENPTRPNTSHGAGLGAAMNGGSHRIANENWEHYKLAMALLEDCIEQLIALKRGRAPQSRTAKGMHYTGEEGEMCFREAIYWFFHEVDPDSERVCSLEWCCTAINAAVGADLNSNMLRDQAVRLGLYPKEYR